MPWRRLLPCLVGPVFWGAGSCAICMTRGFLFASPPGTRTRPAAMIRSFSPLQQIFMTKRSIASAVAGAFGVVNAVSLYVERGKETFHAVHVAAAERLADEARKAGVERLVQISGIGADAQSPSPYIRARGAGRAGGPRGLCRGDGDPAGRDVRPG